MFNGKELAWIKENDEYDYFEYDKEIFESILEKIK